MKKTTQPAAEKTLTKGEKRSLGADAKKFHLAWASAAKGDIKAKYAVGEKARKTEEKYGRTGMEALATAINRSVSYVYSLAAVVKTWNPGALRHLLARSQGRIEFSILTLLSNKKRVDDKRRKALLDKIISEGMSPTKLKHLLFPKGTSESPDPDLTEDGVVDDELAAANDGANGAELDEATNDEANEAEIDETQSNESCESDKAPAAAANQGAAKGHALFSTGVSPLWSYTRTFSDFADQAELNKQQAFISLEEASYEELEKEPLDDLFDELTSAKTANEKLALVCQANIELLNAVMITVQNAINKQGEVAVIAGDGSSLRLLPSNTEAMVQQTEASSRVASTDSVQMAGRQKGI